jgi:hypothetical protein
MALSLRKVFIILVLVFQFSVMATTLYDPLHGPIVGESYRRDERLGALQAWLTNPSPSSKAAYDAELSQLHSYLQKKAAVIILILAFEAVGVYYVWNYGTKKPVA